MKQGSEKPRGSESCDQPSFLVRDVGRRVVRLAQCLANSVRYRDTGEVRGIDVFEGTYLRLRSLLTPWLTFALIVHVIR